MQDANSIDRQAVAELIRLGFVVILSDDNGYLLGDATPVGKHIIDLIMEAFIV